MNQTALFKLSYGVYICTSWDEGRPVGCVANSTMQITSSPATVAVSINKSNYTHRCIEDTGFFAVSVLAEDSDPKLIGRFGFLSARDTDKFEGVAYSIKGKLPVIDDAIAYMSCKVIEKWETATHTVFLGEVLDCDNLRKGKPMTYAYYHEVLKGKTSANAPTFGSASADAESEESAKYVCTICNYEYDGDVPFEELPDDWVCPICGVGKEMFEQKGGTHARKSGWVCDVCGYEYDGEIPFEELPDDWVCPICNMGKEHFRKR